MNTLPRFTMSDLALDKKNMIAWLNYDGNPPTVEVPGEVINRNGFWTGRGPTVTKPVTDIESLDQWWKDYRAELAADLSRKPFCELKPQTHTQFLAECLKELGVKRGGTIYQRVQHAVASRPDLYVGAAEVKAAEAKRQAEILAAWKADHAEMEERHAALSA